MIMLRGGLAALALFVVLTTAAPARAQCFWDGVQWLCWTHPLFPEVSPVSDANPYRLWTRSWGGPNWRFHGWQPR
jgi:hypothetical protein